MENKSSIIGFVLIGILLVVWMWFITPPPRPVNRSTADTTIATQRKPDTTVETIIPVAAPENSDVRWGAFFAADAKGVDGVVTIKTSLYTAVIATRGGLIRQFELTKFKTWDYKPVQLVDYDHGGELSVLFTSADGRLIDTRGLFFESSAGAGTTIELTGTEQYTLNLVLHAGNSAKLVKKLTFTNGSYAVDAEFDWQNMEHIVSNYEYQIAWEHGLRYAEQNSVDESSYAMGYASMAGELKEIDATKVGETPKFDGTGGTDWVACRTKYFAVALMPDANEAQGVFVEGHRTSMPNNGVEESYNIALKMGLKGRSEESSKVTVYLGPLDYGLLKGYQRGLQNMMNLGWAWVIRPIAEYIMIPVFQFLRMIIPNYGIVIIVFALLIKLVTNPLTKSSMKSMRRMQALQPIIKEMKEKYKDDPQRMNQAQMNLYKEYGVNPAGGCLPFALQMPVLFALYAVLRSNIDLRQANFAFWIHDLSIPDTVLKLPFTIPFFGITAFSGLALLMGVTTFVQQKMTVTDPQQKAMIYVMPVFLTLIFNALPAGLNL